MNKNSNTYQILYSAIMVVLVGAVLAFVYMALKPRQDENIANDKRKQILSALYVSATDQDVKEKFAQYITGQYLIDNEGNITDSTTQNVAFDVDMATNNKAAAGERKLPLFVASKDGKQYYVIPAYGAGLWGPIWGYLAVESDGSTVAGSYFSHSSETPGLGARITEQEFQHKFDGKQLYKDGEFKGVEVVKKGQQPTVQGADYVDAISGATITSRGVSDMLQTYVKPYDAFFKKLNTSTR